MIHYYQKYYRKKKVLITGHTGFKGAWLSTFFLLFNSKILGVSIDELKKPNLFNTLKLKKKILHKKCDIRNFKKLKKIFNSFKPDYVFHLAAQSIVSKSHKMPKETFETNFLGTLNILEICKNYKNLKSLIIVTSDKCYEIKNKNKSFLEDDPLGGKDPYSSSKAAVEVMMKPYLSIYKKNKIALASVRAGNVIGGGDWASDRIVPDIVRAKIKKKKFVIRNSNYVRPWQHVFDCLNGYIYLGTKLSGNYKKFSGSYNFGPLNSSKISVLNLSKKISKYLKTGYILKNNRKNIYLETNVLQLNTNKSKKLLNYSAKMDFANTVNYTVNWYNNFFNKNKDMFKFSLKQITNFYKTKY